MRITTLVENDTCDDREDLTAEFGLSLHVQVGGRQILFDTGASGVFADNADALEIDLTAVDFAVLSHHHFDHGGGLERFLDINRTAKVYLGRGDLAGRYFKAFSVIKRPIGIDLGLLRRFGDRFEFVTGSPEVAPGVVLITEIGSAHARPAGNRHLFVEHAGSLVPDPFDHELAMVVREDDGMVVFSGCSHSGVLNMIEAGRARFPGVPIKAVIGGFHLIGLPFLNTMAASRSEVESIGRTILGFSPGKVYSAHCTGVKAYRLLQEVMGDTLESFHTGTALEL
jgi:7,8-dihydropterin-6-yl-methyl-4-(beta-D-ribofuranosyl)aminobenzene 5'-phosphate synthase